MGLGDLFEINANRAPVRRNVSEFFVHGLRYAFPLRSAGKLAKGIPTAYAAPVASEEFVSTGLQPVWEIPGGAAYGQAFEPIYPTAPLAAKENRGLYFCPIEIAERLLFFRLLF